MDLMLLEDFYSFRIYGVLHILVTAKICKVLERSHAIYNRQLSIIPKVDPGVVVDPRGDWAARWVYITLQQEWLTRIWMPYQVLSFSKKAQ